MIHSEDLMKNRRKSRIWFRLAAVVFGISLLVLTELLVRIIPMPEGKPNPHSMQHILNGLLKQGSTDGDWMIGHPLLREHRRISKRKEEGMVRIILTGGSAAQVWPVPRTRSIAARLEQLMTHALDGRPVEVICVAGAMFGSHRARWSVNEMMDSDPDGIIIMSGNNEFMEYTMFQGHPDIVWNGWKKWVYKLRLFQWGLRLRRGDMKDFRVEKNGIRNETPDTAYRDYIRKDWPLCKISAPDIGFPDWYQTTLDPGIRAKLFDGYEANLRGIIKRGRAADCAIVLATVPVNLKDWAPGLSVHSGTLSEDAMAGWYAEYIRGIHRQMLGDWNTAAQSFEAALQYDPEYADSWYRLGQCLLAQNKREAAEQAFLKALNNDGYASRCLPEMNAIVRRVSQDSGISLADVELDIRQKCALEIPGNEVFLDHVHMNDAGIQSTAYSMAAALCRQWNCKAALPESAVQLRRPDDETLEVLRQILRMHLIHHQFDSSLTICRLLDQQFEREIQRLKPTGGIKLRTMVSLRQRNLAVRRSLEQYTAWFQRKYGASEDIDDQRVETAESRAVRENLIAVLRLAGDPNADYKFETQFIERMGIEPLPEEKTKVRNPDRVLMN